jgi:hypothetical protein
VPVKDIKMLELPFASDSSGNLYWLMKSYKRYPKKIGDSFFPLHSPEICLITANTKDRMLAETQFFRKVLSFPSEETDPRAFFHQDDKFYIVEASGHVRILEK